VHSAALLEAMDKALTVHIYGAKRLIAELKGR
jgi:hypothetical protein